jgi:DNA-binding response OmpR family regulator
MTSTSSRPSRAVTALQSVPLAVASPTRRVVNVLMATCGTQGSSLARALLEHGCSVSVVESPTGLADRYRDVEPDVVIVAATLEERAAALDALRWTRRTMKTEAILISEPADDEARVLAINLGADDAVAPVSPSEIVARVAVLARKQREPGTHVSSLGDLHLGSDGRHAKRRGAHVPLTEREYCVLAVLVERPGIAVTKQELLERVWGGQQRSPNAVEAQISGLRRKLHDAGPPVIHTVHGEGYIFRPVIDPFGDHVEARYRERERVLREREEAVIRRARTLRNLEREAPATRPDDRGAAS